MGKKIKRRRKKQARKFEYEMSYLNHYENFCVENFFAKSDGAAKAFARNHIAEMRSYWKKDFIILVRLVRIIPIRNRRR